MDMIEEESAQNLVQSAIHLQTCGGAHEPLQQLLQLLRYLLQNKPNSSLCLYYTQYTVYYLKPYCLYGKHS